MGGVRRSDEEIAILKRNYPNVNGSISIDDILSILPGRNWGSLKNKAKLLGLRMNYNRKLNASVDILLEDTPESYYWMGFIVADGHIANGKRLILTISDKDEEHFLKLCDYVSCKKIKRGKCRAGVKEYNYISMSVQDVVFVPKICEKFGIVSNKTESPPVLPEFSDDQFLCFWAGFIDGDGSVFNVLDYRTRKKRIHAALRIKCHNSWFYLLKGFEDNIYKILGVNKYNEKIFCKINSCGYSEINISDNSLLARFKKRVIKLNVPLMKRKWDKIDENFVSKYEKSKRLKNEIFFLRSMGLNNTRIAEKLSISDSYVSVVLGRGRCV